MNNRLSCRRRSMTPAAFNCVRYTVAAGGKFTTAGPAAFNCYRSSRIQLATISSWPCLLVPAEFRGQLLRKLQPVAAQGFAPNG